MHYFHLLIISTLIILKLKNWVAFKCDGESGCGGFGDRIRGVASVFLMAIAMDRPFRLIWHRKSRFEDYFNVEKAFLDETDNGNDHYRIEFKDSVKEMELFKRTKNLTWIQSKVNNLEIQCNSIAGIQGLLENPAFVRDKIPKWFPGFNVEQDRAELVAAVLKFIVGRPNEKLMELYNTCVASHFVGKNLKIGVQIRNGDHGEIRVKAENYDCFAEKIVKDFPSQTNNREKIVIFVTGDSNDKFRNLVDQLRRSDFHVVTSSDVCGQLTFSHIDKNLGDQTWLSEVKSYLDWFALTQMDRLYISRSGYGETASMISLVPTQRFIHWSTTCDFQPYSMDIRERFFFRTI